MNIKREKELKCAEDIDIIFDHPHKNYPIIHVTGTDGKGSTSSMIASILMEAGYKTGTLNTPGINGLNSTIKINGVSILKNDFNIIHNNVKKLAEQRNIKIVRWVNPLVETSFIYFQKQNVDIAVIETCKGGLTDPTNIISPIVSVITNVTTDHLEVFNNDVMEYAHEKAGIIKPNIPCFVGETPKDNDIKNIILNKAQEYNAPITFTDEENNNLINEYKGLGEYETKYGNFILELSGDYQYTNLNLVLNVIEELRRQGYKISNEHIIKGLENVVKNTKLYGRWQILHRNPTVILDAGHTLDAWSKVTQNLLKMDYNKLHIITAVYNNRDVNKIVKNFRDDENISYYFPVTTVKRIRKPHELMEATNWMQKSKRYESDYVKNTVDKLIKESDKNDIIFIGGNTEYVSFLNKSNNNDISKTTNIVNNIDKDNKLPKKSREKSFNCAKIIDTLLDHPHKNYPIIHVTGTDGKGSTSSMIASILMEAGYKTGTINYPGIYNDIVKVNGVFIRDIISESDRKKINSKINNLLKTYIIDQYRTPVYFNALKSFMFGFLCLKEQNVDITVVEAQSGAATDPSGVVYPIISVLTNISGDHLGVFGGMIGYAHEKAGVIKPNIPCFVGETPKDNDIKNILLNKAHECNAPITFTDEENNNLINEYKGFGEYETKYGNFTLGFRGDCQCTNLNLTLNVIEELRKSGYNITNEHIVKGLENVVKNTKLYGRWQILHRNPMVILDAGHTPDAWSKIIPQLKKLDYNKLHMVIRMCKDKDFRNKCSSMFLDDENINYYFPKTNNERLINPDVWLEKTNWMQKSKRYESDYTVNIVKKLVNEVDKNDIIFIGGTCKEIYGITKIFE